MKTVVSISLGPSRADYDFSTRFLGEDVRVRRFGADGDLERAAALAVRWRYEAEALGFDLAGRSPGDLRSAAPDPTTAALLDAAGRTAATTGALLRSFCDEWAIRRVQRDYPGCLTNARALILAGNADYASARILSEYTKNLSFADPLQLGIPKLLTSMRALDLFTTGAGRVREWVPSGALARRRVRTAWTRFLLRKAMQRAHVIVGPLARIESHTLEELGGKIVITSAVGDESLARLRERGVNLVVDRTPALLDRSVEFDVLDALILAVLEKTPQDISHDDYLRVLEECKLAPRVLAPSGQHRRVNRFAFVIHPLSRAHLRRVKPLDFASRMLPERFSSALERIVAYSPPFIYSKVSGITSPQGVEAEGWLITLGGTPKQLLAHSPEFTYRRLLAAAKMAERLGAQIMGLGAFTKVVGDAGITVAKRATIPITTGNSYSASGALWAAQDAARRMGLLSISPEGRVRGKAMVVGATGAIGSVCSRLLAMAFDEVHLVSPEVAKLLALKETIQRDTPQAKVELSSRARENLRDMDLIVTATSGAGKKVLDITLVKPGAIITDVARPLDLSPEDIALRPDVLVIESGEILLPGKVKMKTIGLPPNVAYACLAETIVLALEGRFECFTVGRNIEWEKVKEIYKLGLKHGMRLAAISGVNGVYSDADIQRVRDLALQKRGLAAETPSPAPSARTATSSRSRRRPARVADVARAN